jgi:hypothetical protein
MKPSSAIALVSAMPGAATLLSSFLPQLAIRTTTEMMTIHFANVEDPGFIVVLVGLFIVISVLRIRLAS